MGLAQIIAEEQLAELVQPRDSRKAYFAEQLTTTAAFIE